MTCSSQPRMPEMPDSADMSLHRAERESNGVADVADILKEWCGRRAQAGARVRVAREVRGRLAMKAALRARAVRVIGAQKSVGIRSGG